MPMPARLRCHRTTDMDLDDPADLEPPLDTGRDSGESPLDIDLDGPSVDDTGSEPSDPDSPEAETGVYDTGDSDTADVGTAAGRTPLQPV